MSGNGQRCQGVSGGGALSERTDMPHSDRGEEPAMNVGGAFPPAARIKMKPGPECL